MLFTGVLWNIFWLLLRAITPPKSRHFPIVATHSFYTSGERQLSPCNLKNTRKNVLLECSFLQNEEFQPKQPLSFMCMQKSILREEPDWGRKWAVTHSNPWGDHKMMTHLWLPWHPFLNLELIFVLFFLMYVVTSLRKTYVC